jgi:hypothetical protein
VVLQCAQLGAYIRIEGGAHDARELCRAECAQHLDLGLGKHPRDALGLLDRDRLRCAVAAAVDACGVDLDREQDLVLLGHTGAGRDQLQVGLDDWRAPRRHARVAGLMQPARQLVAPGRRGSLEPLQPADRRARRRPEDAAPT